MGVIRHRKYTNYTACSSNLYFLFKKKSRVNISGGHCCTLSPNFGQTTRTRTVMRLTTACCKRVDSVVQTYLLFITFGAGRQDTAFNSPPDNKPKNVKRNPCNPPIRPFTDYKRTDWLSPFLPSDSTQCCSLVLCFLFLSAAGDSNSVLKDLQTAGRQIAATTFNLSRWLFLPTLLHAADSFSRWLFSDNFFFSAFRLCNSARLFSDTFRLCF